MDLESSYQNIVPMKLKKWQSIIKPRSCIIYNASEFEYQNDKWVPFTIGVSYQYIFEDNIQRFQEIQIGNHERLVFSAFSENTDSNRRGNSPVNRRSIAENLRKNGINNIGRIHSSTYFSELPKYKFVISPEGNGIDCHRHYEALLAGCIPIVEDHEGIREKYKGCPVLYTKDYSEINEEYLNKKYEEMVGNNDAPIYDFSKLILNNYSKEIQEQIKANGNYWGRRTTGRNWY